MSVFFVHRSMSFAALSTALVILLCVSTGFAQEDTSQVDPVKVFNQGQDAHEKGDLQTALKFYEEAIKLAPEFPEAEYQRGAVLTSLGKINEAEKAFRRAIELKEDWAFPMVDLASLLISINRFPEAEKILAEALEIDDKYFPAYVVLTELHLRTKASAEVLKGHLAKLRLLTSQPKPPASIWAAQGAVERALGDKPAAKKSLDTSLTIEPSNSFALSERTEISLSENNFEQAIADAKMLLKLSPSSTSAKMRLAQIYAASGNSSEALTILDVLDASNAEVSSLRNSIAAYSSNDVSALEKQLQTDAKNVVILERLCNLMRTANPQKALEYCRRASAAEPRNLNHTIGFGAALVQAKQFEDAITLFRRLLQIAPESFTVRANLATALFESKRFAEAKAEYIWLAEKKPELAIVYYFLAITYDQMGEYVNALANYRQFLLRADTKQNQLEIDKVNLRLPAVQKLAKQKGNKQ